MLARIRSADHSFFFLLYNLRRIPLGLLDWKVACLKRSGNLNRILHNHSGFSIDSISHGLHTDHLLTRPNMDNAFIQPPISVLSKLGSTELNGLSDQAIKDARKAHGPNGMGKPKQQANYIPTANNLVKQLSPKTPQRLYGSLSSNNSRISWSSSYLALLRYRSSWPCSRETATGLPLLILSW